MPLLFWGLLLVPLVLALPLAYVVARRTLGPTAGTRHFLRVMPILLGTTVLGVLLFRFVPRNVRIDGFVVFELGSVLFVVGFAGYIQYRTKQAGALLLDLGQPRALRFLRIIGYLMVAVAIVSAVFSIVDRDMSLKDVAELLFRLSLGGFQVLLGSQHTQLREQGLLANGELLWWHKVTGYQWEVDRSTTLTLQVNTVLPMGRRPSLPIPPEHRDAVDRFLAQHIGRASAVGSA